MVGFRIHDWICSMKKILYFLFVFMAAFFISSCGNKELTPKNIEIAGPLGEYFKVVDRAYHSNNGIIYIEVQRIQDGLPAPWKADFGKTVGWNDGEIEPSFSVEFYDKNGNIVCKAKTLALSSKLFNENKDELQNVVNLAIGEAHSISFDLESAEATKFSLSSSFECHPAKIEIQLSPAQEAAVKAMVDRYQQMAVSIITQQKEKNTLDYDLYVQSQELANSIHEKIDDYASIHKERFEDIESHLTSSATLGANDHSLDFLEKYKNDNEDSSINTDSIDSILNDFDKVVDKYVELFNASKNGNTEVANDAALYMQKCEEISARVSNINDEDFTAEQLNRLIEISTKLSNLSQ